MNDAERAALGCMIGSADDCALGLSVLRDDAMSGPCASVLKSIRRLHPRDASLLSVADDLERHGELDFVGGRDWLASLFDAACAPQNLEAACSIINDDARRRALKSALLQSLADLDDPATDTDAVVDSSEARILAVRDDEVRSDLEALSTIIPRIYTTNEAGIETGLHAYDSLTGGLHASQLVVLAARPGVGKTAMAAAWATNIARRANPVLYVSVEMGDVDMAQRFVALAGCSMRDVATASRESKPYADEAMHFPVSLYDNPNPSLIHIRAAIRRSKPAVVFVDYLQLVRPHDRRVSRIEQVDEIARDLKRVAKEFHVPVVALAQLNRNQEGTTGKMRPPVLSDLRESGGIEANADVVAFIHRDYYDAQTTKAELIVAKQRQGPMGARDIVFDRERATFRDEW